MHYYFEKNGFRYSLVGTVITVFSVDGCKIKHLFFDSKRKAKQALLSM